MAVREPQSKGSKTSLTPPRTINSGKENPFGNSEVNLHYARKHSPTVPAATLEYAVAEKEFLARYPEIERTAAIGALRDTEFTRLDKEGHVYLDYTGGGLYAESQVRDHIRMMVDGTFGNPHSSNPTSLACTRLVEQARVDVLKFFNTDLTEYDCIFTANASAALRIVGESYPFQPGGHYLLPSDNHNSVNGIREFARAKGAKVTYIRSTFPNLRIDPDTAATMIENLGDSAPKLFAFPAQSNFSGVQHSLEFIEQAQRSGWDVLLDAAAFAPTNKIDLKRIKPEFMALSFYKIFGYPTGIGALIVKRSALAKLSHRPWFAGGTIEVALVANMKHWLHSDHEAFEDGTVNYLGIPALTLGIRLWERMGMDNIHSRVMAMTGYFIEQLLLLKHKTGRSVVQIYGPQNQFCRGATVTLNFFDPEGTWILYSDVEVLANARHISLRSGCFCNPGDSEDAFQWKEVQELADTVFPMTKPNFAKTQRVAGAVRFSLGIATNFADLYKALEFCHWFIDKSHAEICRVVSQTQNSVVATTAVAQQEPAKVAPQDPPKKNQKSVVPVAKSTTPTPPPVSKTGKGHSVVVPAKQGLSPGVQMVGSFILSTILFTLVVFTFFNGV